MELWYDTFDANMLAPLTDCRILVPTALYLALAAV
jgi:hypothetical protein